MKLAQTGLRGCVRYSVNLTVQIAINKDHADQDNYLTADSKATAVTVVKFCPLQFDCLFFLDNHINVFFHAWLI